MRRVDSLEKTLMLGGIGGRRRRDDRGWDGWMASPTQWTWVWVNSGSWWWTGRTGILQLMGSQRVGHDLATELNWTAPWKKTYNKHRQHISIFKSRHHFANKVQSSQSYDFSSSHVWMWDLYNKEGWAPNNRCFWTVVLEKTLKSPLVPRRLNQSILKELNSEYSLEGLMLKLKL